MTTKAVYASIDREAKVASRPTNSIAAAAATAWTSMFPTERRRPND